MTARPRPFRLRMPEPLEADTHAACAQALDRLLMPPAVWFTYPAGAVQLSPQQMARYSRLGLKRGLPDIWVLHQGTYCIELKRRGAGRLSKTTIGRMKSGAPRILVGQEEMFPRLLAAGVKDIAICHSVDEVLAQLQRWQRAGAREDRRMSENSYFTVLRLPGLKIEIHAPEGPPLPSDDNELEGLLDVAIDNAAYEGDWSGLVLLRQCLLKWADEAQDALVQIAKDGPYKSAIARDHAA